MKDLTRVLKQEPRIAYALVFGSAARATMHEGSDLDVAIGLRPGTALDLRELGALVADLERVTARSVDLLILDDAPPALAFRAFRDGIILFDSDHRALADRKARAVLEYLDFRPIEALVVRGVLAAARGR